MLATQITSHVADAKARLLSQFQGAPRINALVGALAAGCQSIENALFSLDAGRQLNLAYGAQLDAIGLLVNLPRRNLTDEVYRAILKGTIAEQNSDGTTATIETIVGLLYQTKNVFIQTGDQPSHSRVFAPAQISLGLGSPSTASSLFGAILPTLQASLPAGVALASITQYNATKAFSMAGPQPWVGGFGDATNPAVGAPMASAVYTNPAQ